MERTPEQIETELLVYRAQDGEPDALRELFRMWNTRLLAHANRVLGRHASLDAPDATQEAWLAIAKRINRLSDPALFVPWAHRIVSFKCADMSRKAIRERSARERKPEFKQDDGGQRTQDVRESMEQLNTEQRIILSMRYGSDLSVAHIALAIGVPVGTVKSRLHAARAALKHRMDQSQGE